MPDQSAAYLIHCIVGDDMQDVRSSILDARLFSIQYKDIAAVVREVDTRIAEELESHKEQLRDWLTTYQRANIDIFHHCTMLPLRFGTIVDSREEVEDFLSTSYIHIKWALDRLRGKTEFVVHVSWDLNAVLQGFSRDKGWLHEAEESINLTDQLEIGRLLFKAADAKKKEIVNWVHSKLSEISLDSSAGRGVDESIIMDRSYLIHMVAEESLDKAMAELAEEGGPYLSIKYVGPMPPYSFAPLEFRTGNFELIDQARKMLSLPERANSEDIKSSYRRLSLKYHPDKNPGDEQTSEHFRQIDAAYRIIQAYCYSCEGSLESRDEVEYSFTKGDVEEVFIVERELSR